LYGYSPPIVENERASKSLSIENLKRLYEENLRLKGDIEKLLDNIEYSR
jgi:hypothetical protein